MKSIGAGFVVLYLCASGCYAQEAGKNGAELNDLHKQVTALTAQVGELQKQAEEAKILIQMLRRNGPAMFIGPVPIGVDAGLFLDAFCKRKGFEMLYSKSLLASPPNTIRFAFECASEYPWNYQIPGLLK